MPRTIIIITVLLFLASIAGGFFLWWPEYQEFMALRKELQRKEEALQEKIEYFKNLREISKKLEDYPEEMGKIESALPDPPLEPAFLRFVQVAASENGLVTDSLGNVAVSRSQGVREITFSGSFSGSYSALKNFLSAVYQNARMINVESISFGGGGEEGKTIFDFEIGFKTHGFSEKSGGEAPEGEGGFPAPGGIK